MQSSRSSKKSKKKKFVAGFSSSTKQKQSWTKALGRVQKSDSQPKIKQPEEVPSVTQNLSEMKITEEVSEMKPVKSEEKLNGKYLVCKTCVR